MDTNTPRYHKTSFWQRIALVIFGLFLTLILIETGLRLGGFIILSLQELRNRISLRQKGDYRILCLGESTTQDQYPAFLEEALNQGNTGIKFSVIDKGTVGANTSRILHKLESYLDTYHPDMVITMMGINDMGTHMPYEPVSDSKAINFLKSFRIYKLTRLLWLHIITKLKELRSHYAAFPKSLLQKTKLQQAYVEDKDSSSSKEPLEFKKAIEINPRNYRAYIKLGRFYRDQGKFSEAEKSFKKAIEINPRNYRAYAELGQFYQNQGKFSEAEESYKKAIELNPGNYRAYVELGWFYQGQEKFSEAEESFKRAIELNPRNYEAYVELGCFYLEQGRSFDQSKFSEAEKSFKKAIEINPKNYWSYNVLGWCYLDQGKFSEAEKSFKKAIELTPRDSGAYIELGWCYLDQGKFSETEESFKKAIEINPRNDMAYGALKVLYIEMGKMELARKYAEEARDIRLNYYSPITANNYQKLKAILDKRGIIYVCVQYPMRNIESLKKIFQGNDKGIIFVDNEKVFKDEVAKYGRQDYFKDTFGGDFGHCTEKGNRLLAENIAKVILKEVFGK